MKYLALLAMTACACTAAGAAPDFSVEDTGPREVGTAHATITDAARGRTLEVQAWFPTASVASGVEIERLEETHRSDYAALLAAAPACPTRVTRLTVEATPADDGPFPTVLFSHCHNCTRLSGATIAAR